jgi:hypothetical protein
MSNGQRETELEENQTNTDTLLTLFGYCTNNDAQHLLSVQAKLQGFCMQ